MINKVSLHTSLKSKNKFSEKSEKLNTFKSIFKHYLKLICCNNNALFYDTVLIIL